MDVVILLKKISLCKKRKKSIVKDFDQAYFVVQILASLTLTLKNCKLRASLRLVQMIDSWILSVIVQKIIQMLIVFVIYLTKFIVYFFDTAL